MELEEIGYRIKKCRKAQKITQEKLAEIVDVSPHYIYEIERGSKSMSLYILTEIARALSVSTDYLLLGGRIEDLEYQDHLDMVLKNLPPNKRDAIAKILTCMLPYLK